MDVLKLLEEACTSGTLTPHILTLLGFLKVTSKDILVDTIKDKIKSFIKSKKTDPSILIQDLKEIEELKDITNYDISNAFNITFGNITNSKVASMFAPNAQNVYQDCTIYNTANKEEITKLILETLETIPLDNPKTIESLRPFFNKVYRTIEECYNYEDKKDIIKKLIKERVEKSVNDDFRDLRNYDTAIEAVSQITFQELNLLALCNLACNTKYPENLTREVCIKSIAFYCQKFRDIGNIDNINIGAILNKFGFGFSPNFQITPFKNIKDNEDNEDNEFFNDLLKEANMDFLNTHKKIFMSYCKAFRNNGIFMIIGKTHYNQVMPTQEDIIKAI